MLKLNCKKESYGNLNFIRLLLVKKIGGKLFEHETMYLYQKGQLKDIFFNLENIDYSFLKLVFKDFLFNLNFDC